MLHWSDELVLQRQRLEDAEVLAFVEAARQRGLEASHRAAFPAFQGSQLRHGIVLPSVILKWEVGKVFSRAVFAQRNSTKFETVIQRFVKTLFFFWLFASAAWG